jgi:PTS system fructose-specific IIA component/PTS system nitrogen regulatory IIA component
MKLKDFIVPGAVTANLEAADRNGVIRELVGRLVAAGAIPAAHSEAIARAVTERERQGTTGFGKGVAVPHSKHDGVPRVMAAVGRSAAGVDFSALDRAPVYIMVLLLSPTAHPDHHLQAMECIFRHLQRDNFRRFLRQAETPQAILELLEEADSQPQAG